MTQRQRKRPPERGYAQGRRPAGNRPSPEQYPARRRPAQGRAAGPGRPAGSGYPARQGRPAGPGLPAANGRKRGRLWLIAIPIAALTLWLVLTHYVFLVRNVEVVGVSEVPAADVVRLSGIPLGGRLNAVDESTLRTRLESTGRLAFVSLEKRYPNTVVLNVRERSRDALILQAGKLVVLDSDGYVVSAGDTAPEDGMPYVLGLKASTYRLGWRLDAPETRLSAMKAVLEALKAHGATAYISEINLEHLNDIELIARKGTVISLGDAENMNNKVIWMVGALQDLESRGETLGVLDVSSGSKADFLSGATPTPAPTPTPVPELPAEAEGVIGQDAI